VEKTLSWSISQLPEQQPPAWARFWIELARGQVSRLSGKRPESCAYSRADAHVPCQNTYVGSFTRRCV
jgi:hypothetical protein